MKAKRQRQSQFQCRRTVRLSATEDCGLREQAERAGLSVAEYMRRRLFGGRLVMAKSDDQTIRELRRLGGLLKHNFESVGATGRRKGVEEMNRTLSTLRQAIEALIRTA